jgi:uncharacterized oligopeptide transporter (OPT) family protein
MAALHPTARLALLVGLAAGAVLVVLERTLPARARAFVPSPSGLGLGMVIPGPSSVAICLGAALAATLRRLRPAAAERLVVPAASGLIAGESIMGIAIALAVALGLGGAP